MNIRGNSMGALVELKWNDRFKQKCIHLKREFNLSINERKLLVQIRNIWHKTEGQICLHFFLGGRIINSTHQLFNISYPAWNGFSGLCRKWTAFLLCSKPGNSNAGNMLWVDYETIFHSGYMLRPNFFLQKLRKYTGIMKNLYRNMHVHTHYMCAIYKYALCHRKCDGYFVCPPISLLSLVPPALCLGSLAP